VRDKDPMGRPVFWFTVKPLEDEVEGTDRWAFANNWVSITPLRLDLTAEKDLSHALALPFVPAMSGAKDRKQTYAPAKKCKSGDLVSNNSLFAFSRNTGSRGNALVNINTPQIP
jgi:hypothetical protein